MDENSGVDIIRKSYRKLGKVFFLFFFQPWRLLILIMSMVMFFHFFDVFWGENAALQLHPDKNKHPKAELAFKLVSEVSLSSEISIHSLSFLVFFNEWASISSRCRHFYHQSSISCDHGWCSCHDYVDLHPLLVTDRIQNNQTIPFQFYLNIFSVISTTIALSRFLTLKY